MTVTLMARQALGGVCPGEHPATIERLNLGSGGHGYRMTYCIAVPIENYWQFKTDFDNDFLTTNPHISSHRFVNRQGNLVLTENSYAHNTKRLFRWQTVVHHQTHRLDFELLNPDEAGQDFHLGTIKLANHGAYTAVYQEARFKFAGDALWAFYPWRGGMRSFLQSFVAWEQQKAREWYSDRKPSAPAQPEQKLTRQIYSRNWRHPDP